MNFLGLVLMLACTPTALLDLAIPKWQADKHVRIEDAYKYLFQATRGGEHAAPDRASAKVWLDREWEGLSDPVKGEQLWEPLCPGGEIGRFNLRPFRKNGGTPDDIVDAFVASASDFKSDPSTFTDVWAELGTRLKKKRIGQLDHKAWNDLDVEMRQKDYPAVHHSKDYNKAKRPAYRILTADEARRLQLKYAAK